MSQESALGSLPSFSKSAFSSTVPQLQYKQVRRIKSRNAKQDDRSRPAAEEECRPTMIRLPVYPDAKNIILINGVDPDPKHKVDYKSTGFSLPFLYSGNFARTPATNPTPPKPTPKSQPTPKPQPTPVAIPGPSSGSAETRERKRPKRESERRVEVELTVQPERKRPKREAERRAEALAKQGKQ